VESYEREILVDALKKHRGNAAAARGPSPAMDPEWLDFWRRFFEAQGQTFQPPREQPQVGQGSGFILTPDGYILSNHHVVGNAQKIHVRLHDGREFEARRIGTDARSEIALIKIEAADLPVLPYGDSSALRVGEWVLAIGNPFGLNETVTLGVVSALGRNRLGIADYENFIQTDAAINPGHSGGPLLNMDGEVVGVNTAIFSRSGGYMGIGFAVPMDMARRITDQLRASGSVARGFLGVVISDLTLEMAGFFGLTEAQGILVAEVMRESPAETAGLQRDDVIVSLNQVAVRDVTRFRHDVAALLPGTELALEVLREGERLELAAVAGRLPDDPRDSRPAADPPAWTGLRVRALRPDDAGELELDDLEGVLVEDVAAGSAAATEGIRPGEVVLSVNRKPVNSVAAFETALAETHGQGKALLLVKNAGGARYVVLHPGDAERAGPPP
jgi:serine protease Do